MHRGSHHLDLWVQGIFGSGVPGDQLYSGMTHTDRNSLRQSLRQKRRQLSSAEQGHAARQNYELIVGEDFFVTAERIAFYLASDGEIDPSALLAMALTTGKRCFLPVIGESNPDLVSFAPYSEESKLTVNRWDIAEPCVSASELVDAESLDLVFVPLVGFDETCSRLGRGKGFYDRSFAFKSGFENQKPLLVGLAHECQRLDRIPVSDWDVRLDAVITDRKSYRPDTA